MGDKGRSRLGHYGVRSQSVQGCMDTYMLSHLCMHDTCVFYVCVHEDMNVCVNFVSVHAYVCECVRACMLVCLLCVRVCAYACMLCICLHAQDLSWSLHATEWNSRVRTPWLAG